MGGVKAWPRTDEYKPEEAACQRLTMVVELVKCHIHQAPRALNIARKEGSEKSTSDDKMVFGPCVARSLWPRSTRLVPNWQREANFSFPFCTLRYGRWAKTCAQAPVPKRSIANEAASQVREKRWMDGWMDGVKVPCYHPHRLGLLHVRLILRNTSVPFLGPNKVMYASCIQPTML